MEEYERHTYAKERERAVRRLNLGIILALPVLLLATGCSSSGHLRRSRCVQYENLIFNPQFTFAPEVAVSRMDWPSTAAFHRPTEHLEYRETIIDRQGRFGGSDDYLYRRFDSIRVGRSGR